MEQITPEYVARQKILLECVDLEIAVSLIYREFMRLFPAESDFWMQLALEEEDHARLYLAADLLQVTGEYAGIRFPPAANVTKTLAFTEQIKDQLRKCSLSLHDALDIALMLEKTVAESMVFELPESGDPVIINLRKIISDTEAHIDRIDRFKLEKGYSLPG
jgi:hypothetical protein